MTSLAFPFCDFVLGGPSCVLVWWWGPRLRRRTPSPHTCMRHSPDCYALACPRSRFQAQLPGALQRWLTAASGSRAHEGHAPSLPGVFFLLTHSSTQRACHRLFPLRPPPCLIKSGDAPLTQPLRHGVPGAGGILVTSVPGRRWGWELLCVHDLITAIDDAPGVAQRGREEGPLH